MSRIIKSNGNRSITVVQADKLTTAISKTDAEMDTRAKAAVKFAVNRAIICKKPVAKYDRVTGRAYIETVDGEKKYV